jgi:hypothetical protein
MHDEGNVPPQIKPVRRLGRVARTLLDAFMRHTRR